MNKFVMRRMRHGFNLVEAAIVLGVIGLVIGGIWVAASAATEAHRVNETAKGMMSMCERIGNVFPSWGAPAGYSSNITAAAGQAGVVPGDWQYNGSSYVTPLGAPMHNVSYWGTTSGLQGHIGIVLGGDNAGWRPTTPAVGLNQSQCRRFIANIAGGRRSGVQSRMKYFILYHSDSASSLSFNTMYYLDSPNNLSPRADTVNGVDAVCGEYNEIELVCTNTNN